MSIGQPGVRHRGYLPGSSDLDGWDHGDNESLVRGRPRRVNGRHRATVGSARSTAHAVRATRRTAARRRRRR